MEQLIFKVPQMDCAAEEQLVRMQLADRQGVKQVTVDLESCTVAVVYTGSSVAIEQAMQDLHLGASLIERKQVDKLEPEAGDEQQRKLLVVVLLINAALFVLEIAVGFIAQSMSLVADSLDMLADAIVYGLSL
jgi:cation transport ATPase